MKHQRDTIRSCPFIYQLSKPIVQPYQRARTPPLPSSEVEDGVVVVLSGVEDGVVVLSGLVDGVVVLSGDVDGVIVLSGVEDGVVGLPGVPGMLLGVVVESVGLPPAGEIDPPGAAVGILMPPGVIEPPDDGTTTSAPVPPEPLGAAEGLVGVPLGAALGEFGELPGVVERSMFTLPGLVERSKVGPTLEGSAVGAEEGFVGVPLGVTLFIPPPDDWEMRL
ncbi:hypothetical protein [Phormidesmis priestleyi]|uniref:hypothetical protein n=1 Tax=Phormidesmis priestleyi TaxID=268141 RepID=UPI00116060DE|nr:hypothetical protein [Phormidesmis priestleyi]